MPMNTVVYLCYGSGIHHDEAVFSILSAFRFCRPDDGRVNYVVYTDTPERYEPLGVAIRLVTAKELTDWLDGDTYIHRRKTMVVLDALRRFPGNVAFVDSDTYFKRSPLLLFDKIGPGRTLLHVREASLKHSRLASDHALFAYLYEHGVRCLDGSVLPISPDDAMWNTGVLGLNTADAVLLEQVAAATNPIWRQVKAYPIEQLLTGFFFRTTRIGSCRQSVYHYWPKPVRIPFGAILAEALKERPGETIMGRAERIYALRPVSSPGTKVKEVVRELSRAVGLSAPGAIKSY